MGEVVEHGFGVEVVAVFHHELQYLFDGACAYVELAYYGVGEVAYGVVLADGVVELHSFGA